MGLFFKLFGDKKEIDPKAEKLLKEYISSSQKEIGYAPRKKASEKAEDFAAAFYKAGKAEGIGSGDIRKMEEKISRNLKPYGLKERINYLANVKSTIENPLMTYVKGTVATVLVAGAAISAANDEQLALAGGILGIGVAAALTKAAAFHVGLPNNEKEEQKVTEYTDLKHAQLALKQLKRQVKATERAAYMQEVKELFAAGYGQPSGSMVQAAVFRKQQGR